MNAIAKLLFQSALIGVHPPPLFLARFSVACPVPEDR
jgi:hypothetical protein